MQEFVVEFRIVHSGELVTRPYYAKSVKHALSMARNAHRRTLLRVEVVRVVPDMAVYANPY